MKRSPSCRRGAASAAACVVLLSAASAGAADNKAIMTQARTAYYTLAAHAFGGFQCDVNPTWEVALQDIIKSNPANAKATMKILNQLKFGVALDATGPAKVTHNSVTPANDKQARGFNQIYGGVEKTLVGFFNTWSMFVRSSPLPTPESAYELNGRDGGWHLAYKEGTANVITEMEKDFVIRELKVTTPEFVSSIRPQFTHTREGLLLTAYQGEYRSQAQGDYTQLALRITYREVDGFQIPAKMEMTGSSKGTPVSSELVFSNCKAAAK
jgi:hypothetical protein